MTSAAEQLPFGRPSVARRRGSRCGLLLALAGVGLLPAGCNKPLFPEGTPRTPFEMHDRMRDQARPKTEPDVFGKPQPALRSRLGKQYN